MVSSFYKYNPRDKHPMTLIMDEMGHLWQKQAHYSGPAGAVDINSDVGDVMKRVGETRWWQHEFSQQHFPSRVLGVIIIRQDSWGRYQQLWKHTQNMDTCRNRIQGCQGFVLTGAPSFVSIPGDVISVNSVTCGISIRPRLLKQMPPSQDSISFSHLIIRIESGSISRSQSDRDAPNPWIGTTIPQSILTLHMMGNEGCERKLAILWKRRFCVGFPNFHGRC